MNKQQQLTPFEQAALKRQESAKRLAGVLIIQAWIERCRAARAAKEPMSIQERLEWHNLIIQAATAQIQHFGYDA
jgi:hypothetical protein